MRDVANAIANAVGANEYGDEVHFTAGRYAKVIGLASLCSEVLGHSVTRPVIPYFLARVGLPLIKLHAARHNQPLLYSRNSAT